MNTSVIITTRNRCGDLKRTLAVLARATPPPTEILITADGCEDGTVEMVRAHFPQCRLQVNEMRLGSIPSRDRMIREASGDIVVSLDDDSYPADEGFFGRLPALFAAHPEAAVLTFPELRDDAVYEAPDKTPESPGRYVPAYANCTAAMRRDFYLRTAGYPCFFEHAYEEPDYALQCYALGGAVLFEPRLTVRHHLSAANRSSLRTHHFNARNELWSVWLRCPWPWLPLVSLFRVWRQFRYACSQGWRWVLKEPEWWIAAARGYGDCVKGRSPVPWRVYRGWMRLARRRVTSEQELKRHFDTDFFQFRTLEG